MATSTRWITAEAYGQLPRSGKLTELVRGEVAQMNHAFPRHGQICANIAYRLRSFLETSPLGHVVANNAGIVTGLNPDTVRGGDVWYVSCRQIPAGPLPEEYLQVAPEIVFEVKSPSDRWSQILSRVAEYLDLGVDVVCVLDPEEEMVRQYFVDRPEVILAGEDPVSFPEQLPGFALNAGAFFC